MEIFTAGGAIIPGFVQCGISQGVVVAGCPGFTFVVAAGRPGVSVGPARRRLPGIWHWAFGY